MYIQKMGTTCARPEVIKLTLDEVSHLKVAIETRNWSNIATSLSTYWINYSQYSKQDQKTLDELVKKNGAVPTSDP